MRAVYRTNEPTAPVGLLSETELEEIRRSLAKQYRNSSSQDVSRTQILRLTFVEILSYPSNGGRLKFHAKDLFSPRVAPL